MNLKKIFKQTFGRIYRSLIEKFRDDLQLDAISENIRLIIRQQEVLLHQHEILKQQTNILTILLSGIHPIDSSSLRPLEEAQSILDMLSPYEPTDMEVIQFIQKIPQNLINKKAICIIGGSHFLYEKELKKRGAQKLEVIELIPYLLKDSKSNHHMRNYVYPTKIPSLALDRFDALISPHPAITAYLLHNRFFHLAGLTKEAAVLQLRHTLSDEKYIRSGIHKAGFTTLKKIGTSSISSFEYATIEKRGTIQPSANEELQTEQYIAYKMPIN